MNPKKKVKLNKEEQSQSDAIDRGEFSSVQNFSKRKGELETIAQRTLAKNKAITIRLSERNLMRLKAAAAREGIPYQTFVSSLIHKNT